MAWLLIEAPDESPRRFRLGNLDAGFGRARTNAVPLADTKCSSFHCVIRQTGETRWTLADTGSRNGTFVNGVKLDDDHPLKDGDEIVIGQTRIRYSALEPSARYEQVIHPDHHADEYESVRDSQGDIPLPADRSETANLPVLAAGTPLQPTVLDLTPPDAQPIGTAASAGNRTAGSSDTSVQIAADSLMPAADQTENISLRDLSRMVPPSGRQAPVSATSARPPLRVMIGGLLLAFLLGGGLVFTVFTVFPVASAPVPAGTPDPALAISLQNLDQRRHGLEQRLSASTSALTDRQRAEAMLLLDRLSQIDDAQRQLSAETRDALQRITRLNDWMDRLANRLGNLDGCSTVAAEVAALRVQLSLIQHELAGLGTRISPTVANTNATDPADGNVAASNNER